MSPMIDLDNQSDMIVPIKELDKIADTLTTKEVELLITDNTEIQKINLEYRQIDNATDVLSFPFEEIPMGPLGSIVISYDYIKKLSAELGHSEKDELCLLFIHGLLHLLGYDHEIDSGQMREKEKEVIEAFNLPKSLIIRTQEK